MKMSLWLQTKYRERTLFLFFFWLNFQNLFQNQFRKSEKKMPIIVKDYTWTQSETKVCINLPLKGTKSTNIDILNSLEYCKVVIL